MVGSGRRGARCVINSIDAKARFPALSKSNPDAVPSYTASGDVVIEHDEQDSIHTHCVDVVRRRIQHAVQRA